MPSHFDPQTKLIANDLQLENELPTVEEAIASVAETAPSPGLGEEMSALGALLDDTPLIDIKTYEQNLRNTHPSSPAPVVLEETLTPSLVEPTADLQKIPL